MFCFLLLLTCLGIGWRRYGKRQYISYQQVNLVYGWKLNALRDRITELGVGFRQVTTIYRKKYHPQPHAGVESLVMDGLTEMFKHDCDHIYDTAL